MGIVDRPVGVPGERLVARRAGIAEPGGAGDLVDPAVAVDVDRRAADLGADLAADLVPDPTVGPLVLEPPDVAVATAGDPVEVAVFIHVDQRGLAHAFSDLVDLVELELGELGGLTDRHRGPGGGQAGAGQQQGNSSGKVSDLGHGFTSCVELARRRPRGCLRGALLHTHHHTVNRSRCKSPERR